MIHHSLLKSNEDKELFIDAIFSNMGISTALFFCNVAPHLRENGTASATALGRLNFVTTGAALYHLKRLEMKGYVNRHGYRAWELWDRYFDWEKALKK